MKQEYCDNCGDPLPKTFRRWCKKPECRRAAHRTQHEQMRQAWRSTKRKSEKLFKGHPDRRCQYPPNARKKCGKSLADTSNYFFCKDHAREVGKWEGIEA